MRILHLIHKPQNRGAETFACQLASHQKKLGHMVKVLAIYEGKTILPWEENIETLEGTKGAFFDWRAWRKLAGYIDDFQPDVLQANSGDTLKYAILSKKVFGWKTVIVFRNASEVGRYLRSKLQKTINSFLYRNVKGVISVSKSSEKDILYHFPFLQNKTIVIPVGLENKSLEPLILLPQNKKHVIHIGGFTFEKNHKAIISIFQKLLKFEPESHLHLIGDGPLKQKIYEMVQYEKIHDNVSFYGYVINPLDYIKAADVLILPSIIEGLPGVLLEAMYCKIPIIAYDVGGISEIVSEQTGVLIPEGDEESFAAAINRTLQVDNSEKVERAYEMVINNFMNETLAKKFIEVYEKVLKEKSS